MLYPLSYEGGTVHSNSAGTSAEWAQQPVGAPDS